jgi:hypothetical protein
VGFRVFRLVEAGKSGGEVWCLATLNLCPCGRVSRTLQGSKNLTVVSNNAGVDDFGLGVLLKSRQVGTLHCNNLSAPCAPKVVPRVQACVLVRRLNA